MHAHSVWLLVCLPACLPLPPSCFQFFFAFSFGQKKISVPLFLFFWGWGRFGISVFFLSISFFSVCFVEQTFIISLTAFHVSVRSISIFFFLFLSFLSVSVYKPINKVRFLSSSHVFVDFGFGQSALLQTQTCREVMIQSTFAVVPLAEVGLGWTGKFGQGQDYYPYETCEFAT